MAADDDAPRRFRVVRADEAKPKRSPNAEAAARYRARQRGEEVPTRKPGPKPAGVTELRLQVAELQSRIKNLELHLRLTGERLARRVSTLTVEHVAKELLDVLRRDHPSHDRPERQVLLRDLVVEIEDRHEHWEE